MVRSGARSKRGFTLAEVLTAVVILSVIGGSIGALYIASMRTYSRGITENLAQQKAAWAVQRMAQDIRLGMEVKPGAIPFDSSYMMIRLPSRPFDADENRHLNEIVIDDHGQAGLVKDQFAVYYRGDADGTLTVTGDRIWREVLAADGATVVKAEVLADHVIDNPLDASGQPAPVFVHYADPNAPPSVGIQVTVEERHGQRVAQATMRGEYCLRN